MLKGNAVIGQSGGPTSVINSSLAGIINSAKENSDIDRIFGMRFGIEGFMKENIVNLSAEPDRTIEKLKYTPSSALGSCRHKLQDEDLPRILEILKKHDIRYLFLIGGNDTMDTVNRVERYASEQNYELCGVGVPKTVDNDLYGTDHTPGFPSAARYMGLSVMQAGILARDMQKVDQFVIYQCIGRDAGWLVGSTAAGKRKPEDAPHMMCFPERSFDRDKFLASVKQCYDKYGFVSIVCGEGITYADGTPVSSSKTADKFGNVEFGAMGGTSVAVVLHRMIAEEFGFRGEFQITESLPMCAADRAVQLDIDEAYMCGREAVNLAKESKSGVMVSLKREQSGYKCTTETVPLSDVAVKARPMPDEYINKEGDFVTQEFMDYLKPLTGELPEYAELKFEKV